MSPSLVDPLRVSLLVATVSTALVLPLAAALGYLFARRDFPGKRWLSAVLVLPLVLPPTAVGYLLLRTLSRDGVLGVGSLGFDPGILLTWRAAVLATSVMAFPLVFRTARVAFEAVDPQLEKMARTLGHGPMAVLRRVTLPLAARGLVAAGILGFIRAIGEFGATVMVAGNIPGRTQTLSSAIYSAQQAGRAGDATLFLAISVIVGLVALLASEWLVEPRGVRPRRT